MSFEARFPLIERRTLLTGAGAAALSSTTGCGLWSWLNPPPDAPGDWYNASRTLHVRPKELAHPKSAADVVALVQDAQKHGQRIRMTGSGHSYSDVALSDDYLLTPQGLQKMLTLEPARLTAEAAADHHYVRVGSGSTLRFLNTELEKRNLAFANLGGWDAQTIVGAFTTGTHGSGLAFGPIAAQIVSLQIVGRDGKVLQIEPTNGITKMAEFPGHLEEDPSIAVELKQADDLFNAVVVSMGCMGVVYAVVLRAVDRFWIRESRELTSWRELTKAGGFIERFLQHPRDPQFPDHVEITVCPYPRHPDQDHDVLLTKRTRLPTPPPATKENTSRGVLGSGHILAEPAAQRISEAVLAKSMDDAKTLPVLAAIHRGLMLAVVDQEFVGDSYKVFNFGDPNLLRVFGVEMAFKLEDAVKAVERAFAIAAEEFPFGRHHSVPITLRFVRAADALLAMQYGRDTAMLEIGSLVVSHGSEELLKTYERAFIQEFSARPHWGLDLSILTSFDQVRQLYPKADVWLDVFKDLNALGTFDGRLTDRLRISKKQRS